MGQIDKLSESEPTEENARILQTFLENEALVLYDPKSIILPEYCKELYGKAVELLLRGYPGIGDWSTPSVIVRLLENRFGCKFPIPVPEYFQPDDGTAPVFDIYRRFSEAILNTGECIEYADFGTFFFNIISPKSKKDILWELSFTLNGREGAIIVTNQRLMVVGPRPMTDQQRFSFNQFFLYDIDTPQFASADFFNLSQIEEITPYSRWYDFSFVVRDIKYVETQDFSIHIAPAQFWGKLHEDTDIKQGDFKCFVRLKELDRQKKDVLKRRYRSLESILLKFQ